MGPILGCSSALDLDLDPAPDPAAADVWRFVRRRRARFAQDLISPPAPGGRGGGTSPEETRFFDSLALFKPYHSLTSPPERTEVGSMGETQHIFVDGVRVTDVSREQLLRWLKEGKYGSFNKYRQDNLSRTIECQTRITQPTYVELLLSSQLI